jgi:hypothetical protein
MFVSQSALSRIARWAVAGLVLTGSSFVALPAQANGAGFAPVAYNFDRPSSDGKSMVVKNGERATVYSQQFVGDDYAGWPAKLKSVFSRSALTLTRSSLSGLTREDGNGLRYWYSDSFADETCDSSDEDSKTFKISADNQCIDYLQVTDQVTVSNSSGISKTLVTNSDSQVLKLGKKNISNTAGVSRGFYGTIEVYDSATVTTVAGEEYIGAGFSLCLNEDLVVAGDVLDLVGTWATAGTPLDSSEYEVNPWGGGATYTVPEDNPYDQVIYFSVQLTVPEPGVHSASADVMKEGSSVIEECPDPRAAPAWPSIETIEGPAGAPKATTTPETMPTWTDLSNPNWDRYGLFPDGFGGAFHYGVTNEEGAGTAHLVNFDSTGAQNSYNSNGYRQLTSNSHGYVDIGRYGAGGANQFTLIPRSKGNYEYTTSTMSGGSLQTTTLTKKNLAKLCQKGYTFSGLYAISAPTVNPTALLDCTGGNAYRLAVVTMVNNTPMVSTRFGVPTKSRPCVDVSYGSNPAATGNEVALIAYTATKSRVDGECTGDGVVSARSIVAISAEGMAVTTPTADPWGELGEPSYLQIAPGSSSGQWVGISLGATGGPGTPRDLFTMLSPEGGNPSTITVGQEIVLDDSTWFGDYPQYNIVKDAGNDNWMLSIRSVPGYYGMGGLEIDGEFFERATVASVSTVTGAVTNGDVVELSGFGNYSSRTGSLFSGSGPNGTTFFAMTGLTSYSSTTWSLLAD